MRDRGVWMRDEDVPGWWRSLGLPGLIDVHVHFLPPRVMVKVWDHFEHADEHYGVAWPVHYKGTDAERVEILRELGVLAYPGLVYPHKAGMAAWLTEWAGEFAASTPECVPSGTFYPEPTAVKYVRAALDAGTRIFKVHVQVGGFDPSDRLLDPVWGMLADAGAPVVVHCGSGPVPGRHTGPGPMGSVLAQHPTLTAVIAHAGAPEYAEHLALVRKYPNVHLDTTMVGTPFMNRLAPLPSEVIAGYADHGDRIVLGSDFPNIPYAYAEQIQAIESWGLGDDWLRHVVHHNGRQLLGLVDIP